MISSPLWILTKSKQEMKANVTVNCVHPGVVRTNLNRDGEGFITGINDQIKASTWKVFNLKRTRNCRFDFLHGIQIKVVEDNSSRRSNKLLRSHESKRGKCEWKIFCGLQ